MTARDIRSDSLDDTSPTAEPEDARVLKSRLVRHMMVADDADIGLPSNE